MTGSKGVGKMTFFGIDMGSKDGDICVEAELSKNADGSFTIENMRSWKHELELTANRAALKAGEK